jgi:hypothetical protein
MKPEIRGYTYQLPGNDKIHLDTRAILNWEPADQSQVELWIVLHIGSKGKQGEDDFAVHIITSNLVSQSQDRTHLLIIPYYVGWEDIQIEIEKIVFAGNDDSWEAFCHRVSKCFIWEFDYLNKV